MSIYRIQGVLHARLHHALSGAERGQGTVEYVALILLVAAIFAAVVTAGKGQKDFGITAQITKALKSSIDGVGGGK